MTPPSSLWTLDIGFLGRDQVILIRYFPFHQEHIVCSSNGLLQLQSLGKASWLFWLFFFGLFSPLFSESESILRLPSYNFSVPYPVICDYRNLAVRSGQPSFSSGSHVSSTAEDPLHFRRYSTLPFPLVREIFTSRILLPHPVAPPPLSSHFVSSSVPTSFLV